MCELSDAAADPGRAGVQGAEPLGSPVFEHRAAVPTPHGGGTIDHSLIRPAQLAPCHDIRYSRCLCELSGASNPRRIRRLHVSEWSVGQCLSIVKLS